MTEKNKNKINNRKFHNDYDNLTDFLHEYVICVKSDVYFRGMFQPEEALIPNAVKNRRKLKILLGYLDDIWRNEDSKFAKSVYKFLNLKLKVFLILDKVPIAIKVLNLAKTEATEEKKNLEVQLDAIERKVDEKMEKITPNLKSSKSSEELQNDIKEFLQSYNIKLNNFGKNHKGDNMASENIERGKRDVLLESEKFSNKISKQSPEENNSIKSKVSNQHKQILLNYLNLEINGLEEKLSVLEKAFKFLKKLGCTFTIPEYCSLSDEVKDEDEKTADKYIDDINKLIEDMHYVKNAENIIKDALRFIFLVQTTITVSQNGNIVKVRNVNSISVTKTSDESTPDDTFEMDSKTDKNNDEDDEFAKHLNKIICFEIDTDGKKIFTVCGQVFEASESKQVVFNCKNEKVKISFIDSQILVSTENNEFNISIRKPVDNQDDFTQTETRK